MSAFERLIGQIDGFIRKFYKNRLIKGLLFFVGIFLLTFLLVVSLEYIGHFNSIVRTILFFSFVLVNGVIFYRYILDPTLKLKSYGKRINHFQAAQIIGSFFPEVSDRLLNTLQLNDRMDPNSADFELIKASVQQRSTTLVSIPFSDAVNIQENKKYVFWLGPILLLMMGIAMIRPELFTQGTERMVKFTAEFPVPPPFEFEMLPLTKELEEGEDVLVKVRIKGNELPEKIYLKSELGSFVMQRTAKSEHIYTIPQISKDLNLFFEAEHGKEVVRSKIFTISVAKRTTIGKIEATLIFPEYLGRETEQIENAGDLVIPEGTKVRWKVLTKNSKRHEFLINSERFVFKEESFIKESYFKSDARVRIILDATESNRKDTTEMNVSVVKDAFPMIQTEEELDSLKDGIRFFSGAISDDHGVSALHFHYRIIRADGSVRHEKMKVDFVKGTQSPFDFAVDFRREDLKLKDQIEYYFVVTDNDGVNGGKSTKSAVYTYQLPDLTELNQNRNEELNEAKVQLKNLMEQAQEFNKEVLRLKQNLNSNKNSGWNQKSQLEKLQEQFNAINQEAEQMKEQLKTGTEEKNQLSEMDKRLLEQAEMIQELLEKVMDEELKDLLDQLEKLLDKQKDDKLDEKLEQVEMSAEEMEKQLERTMELLKKYALDEKIDDLEKELNQLAEEEKELAEEIEKSNDISEEQEAKQDSINTKFESIKKELGELDKMNKDLKRPLELGDPEERAEDIEQELNEAKDQLSKGKSGKASESQKGASEKMKELAKDLDQAQNESNQEQQQEDISMLRNILESLINLSFDQEHVQKRMAKVRDTDPAYTILGKEQRTIVNRTVPVRDSLYELAKRQPMIATFIDKELGEIKSNQDLALEDIEERRRSELSMHQQYSMTAYNNLALMLNESLEEMQKQLQNMMPGSGSCNKPGGKGMPKPGEGMNPGNMKEMLKKQLEQLEKGAQEGGKKPGEKPGKSGGQGSMGMGSKEISKMAAEQSAIRKRLEEMRNELNKDGSGKGNQLSPLIKELEQQEKDLVNKKLDNNLIKRQQEILTRLLESEKALMERDFDEKRESKSGKNEELGNQIRFEEYNKEKLRQVELLRAVDPAYKKYYKDKANEYFNSIY